MALIEINWHPSRKDLRSFGLISLVASVALALLLYLLKGLAIKWASLILLVGLHIFLSSLFSAQLTRLIYLALILVTVPIGLAVSFVMMAAFYFLLLTPLGLFFRLIGRDPLHRKFEPGKKTYWMTHQSHDNLERYFRQS